MSLTLGTKDGHARPRKDPLFETPDGHHHLWWAAQFEDEDGWRTFAGVPLFKSRAACLRWIRDLKAKAELIEIPPMRAEAILIRKGKS